MKALGLSFPGDVSLTGADHLALGKAVTPSIAMIDRQSVLLAEATADLLLARLNKSIGQTRQHILLNSLFIPGGSCASPELRSALVDGSTKR